MRLDDIHAFIDAKRVYERAYRRAFGEHDTEVQVPSVSEFREAATLTDCSIKHTLIGDSTALLKFEYQGVTFWYMGGEEEAEQ